MLSDTDDMLGDTDDMLSETDDMLLNCVSLLFLWGGGWSKTFAVHVVLRMYVALVECGPGGDWITRLQWFSR